MIRYKRLFSVAGESFRQAVRSASEAAQSSEGRRIQPGVSSRNRALSQAAIQDSAFVCQPSGRYRGPLRCDSSPGDPGTVTIAAFPLSARRSVVSPDAHSASHRRLPMRVFQT